MLKNAVFEMVVRVKVKVLCMNTHFSTIFEKKNDSRRCVRYGINGGGFTLNCLVVTCGTSTIEAISGSFLLIPP